MTDFFEKFYQSQIKGTFADRFRAFLLIYLLLSLYSLLFVYVIGFGFLEKEYYAIGYFLFFGGAASITTLVPMGIDGLFQCRFNEKLLKLYRIINLFLGMMITIFQTGIIGFTIYITVFELAVRIYRNKNENR